MNDRERLEAIVKVVRQYLPPDGICIREAMGEIIKLVDPMDEDQYWGKLSEEHLHALKKDMRAKAEKYVPDLPTHNSNLRKAAEQALEALEDIFGKEKKDVGAINALRQALAQPEREWVGLTDEEVKYLTSHFDWRAPKEQFVSVIEAKLKEKNA